VQEIGRGEFSKFVSGKKIAIVAHAPTVVGSTMGKIIDSYDVVVRLNDSLPLPSRLLVDIGTRCDILYTTFESGFSSMRDPQHLVDVGVKVACRPGPILHRTLQKYYDTFKISARDLSILYRIGEDEPYTSHRRELIEMGGIKPTTGSVGVWDLLSFDVKEVAMFGFTFFIGGTYPEYRAAPTSERAVFNRRELSYEKDGTANHIINPEIRYFKKLFEGDSRIRIDRGLEEVLSKY
jgi:hypothetical protein